MGRLLAHMPVYGPASGGIHALIASSSPTMPKMLSLGATISTIRRLDNRRRFHTAWTQSSPSRRTS